MDKTIKLNGEAFAGFIGECERIFTDIADILCMIDADKALLSACWQGEAKNRWFADIDAEKKLCIEAFHDLWEATGRLEYEADRIVMLKQRIGQIAEGES